MRKTNYGLKTELKIKLMRKNITCFLLFLSVSIYAQVITIDGNKSDWAAIPILSEPGVFPYTKVYVTNDSVYYMIGVEDEADKRLNAGVSNYFVSYIDADRDPATGEKHWTTPQTGNDYQLTNTFHFWSGSAMVWKWHSIDTFGTALVAEAGFAKAKMLTIPDQPEQAKIPLATNFSLGFRYKANNTDQYLPAVDWNFPERKTFSVKPRTEIQLVGSGDKIFSSSNAYYMPFMKDSDIDQYLDFQSASYSTQNPLHWASWAVNLTSPGIYNVKFTRKCADGGKLIFSLVDMATNEPLFTSAEIWYQVNADDFAEQALGQLDLSAVPTGKYMLKVKNNTTWGANLKIQQIILANDFVNNTAANTSEKSFLARSQANTLIFNSLLECDIIVYTITGKVVHTANQITEMQKTLPKGVYVLQVNMNGKRYAEKIML